MAAAAGPSGEVVPIDEDAAELQFPFELQTKTLLTSEVNILLEHQKQLVCFLVLETKFKELGLIKLELRVQC
jgi:hypothetical protein